MDEAFDWQFNFSLSEKCECREAISSHLFILHLERDIQNPNLQLLTGFTIKLRGANEAGLVESANRSAKAFSDFLSVKSNRHTFATMTSSSKFTKDGIVEYLDAGKISTSWRTSVDLDMHDGKLLHLIQSDDDTVQQFHHANLGLKHEELGLFGAMVTEYYQVVEKAIDLPDKPKYKALRDTLSHQRDVTRAKQNVENHYGVGYFTFTQNNEFDHNSPTNMARLKQEAKKLKASAMHYLDSKT